MRWTKAGEMEGGKILWSGDESRHEAEVGFLLGNKARDALMGYKPVSDKTIAARFRAQPYNITVLRVQPSPMLLYTVSPSQLPDWLLFCVLHV